MELNVEYKAHSEHITVGLRGEFDIDEAAEVIESVINGDEEPRTAVVAAGADGQAQENLVQSLLNEKESQAQIIKTLKQQRDNAENGEYRFEEVKALLKDTGVYQGRTVLETVRELLRQNESLSMEVEQGQKNWEKIAEVLKEHFSEFEKDEDGAYLSYWRQIEEISATLARIKAEAMRREQQIMDMQAFGGKQVDNLIQANSELRRLLQEERLNVSGEAAEAQAKLQAVADLIMTAEGVDRADVLEMVADVLAAKEEQRARLQAFVEGGEKRREQYKKLETQYDILARAIHDAAPGNTDQTPLSALQVLAGNAKELEVLRGALEMKSQVIAQLEQKLRVTVEDAKVTLIRHPDAESGDERVAVLPVLPNASLAKVLQVATTMSDGWIIEQMNADNGVEGRETSFEEFQFQMNSLKEELDKVWVGTTEAEWSRVVWIMGSALRDAPPDVQEWVGSLASG